MHDPFAWAFTPDVEKAINDFEMKVNRMAADASINVAAAMPEGSPTVAVMAVHATLAHVAMVAATHIALAPMLLNGMSREDIETIIDETYSDAKAVAFDEAMKVIRKRGQRNE